MGSALEDLVSVRVGSVVVRWRRRQARLWSAVSVLVPVDVSRLAQSLLGLERMLVVLADRFILVRFHEHVSALPTRRANVQGQELDAGAREALAVEVRPPELPGLLRRETRSVERVDDLVGQFSLVSRKRRRIVPAQSSANVLVDPRLRSRDLIGAPVQVTHLLEKRLESLFFDPHQCRTVLNELTSGPTFARSTPLGTCLGRR